MIYMCIHNNHTMSPSLHVRNMRACVYNVYACVMYTHACIYALACVMKPRRGIECIEHFVSMHMYTVIEDALE